MLHDEDDANARPTIEEGYITSMGASNLKYDHARTGAVDMIIAAGINPHRMGLALLRLRSEWDGSAKPIARTPEQVRSIAGTYAREPNGLVRVQKPGEKPGVMEEVTPMVVAQREADCWHDVEMRRLLGRMKSLPIVRSALVHWAGAAGIEGPEHVVAAALLWWLAPSCLTCQGIGKRVVEGTGRTSGKPCKDCRGTREARIPHGFLGRKVLGYMSECMTAAKGGFKATKWGHKSLQA